MFTKENIVKLLNGEIIYFSESLILSKFPGMTREAIIAKYGLYGVGVKIEMANSELSMPRRNRLTLYQCWLQDRDLFIAKILEVVVYCLDKILLFHNECKLR